MGEGYFLRNDWRTGEALVGSAEGVRRAASVRRAGAHRRWDSDGLAVVRGVPWSWSPEAVVQPGYLRVRFLIDEEKKEGQPKVYEGERKIYRMNCGRRSSSSTGSPRGARDASPC